jgi:hypothetical protein
MRLLHLTARNFAPAVESRGALGWFFVRLVGLAPPIQREFPRAKSNLFD